MTATPSTALPSPATPRNPRAAGRLARGAFWVMTRQVTVVSAGVDVALLLLFLAFGSPLLAWINLASIAMYGAAYWMLGRRWNTPALLLIWVEVLGHAALGSMLVGWDSGFHYYLLMFIPAIVVSGSRRSILSLLVVLFLFYVGLHAASRATGVLEPLSPTGLMAVHTFNVAIVFAMASYTARFYYLTVRRAERKLVELATTEPLTRLCNRRHLLALAGPAIARARRQGRPSTVVIADIDHFKRINDRHGHEAGDLVLAHVGGLLAGLCGPQDVVARWGGEEFLILLPGADLAAGTALAERIRLAVAASPTLHGEERLAPTLSLGVAALGAQEALNAAIARADRVLYLSKEQGRDRTSVAA